MPLPDAVVRAIGKFASEAPASLCEELAGRLTAEAPAVSLATAAEAFGNPRTRSAVARLLKTWTEEAREAPVELLAGALRSAASAVHMVREAESTELLWTGPSSPGASFRRTDEALLELMREAKDRLTIVTFAAYRVPEIRAALEQAVERGVSVRFVGESEDASGGRLSHDAGNALGAELAARIRCYTWPLDRRKRDAQGRTGMLHAKCAVADRRLLFVSSANLTEHALDLNMEMGILLRGGRLPAEAARHFDSLVQEGFWQLLR